MELRVLAVGDVVGDGGLQCLEKHLRSLKKLYRADFCVVNGENASGTGLTPRRPASGPPAGASGIFPLASGQVPAGCPRALCTIHNGQTA